MIKKKGSSSIRTKILIMFLATAMAGLLASMAVSAGNLLEIRSASIQSSGLLGEEVAQKSEEALIAQMRQNIASLAEDKSSASTAAALGQYLSYAEDFSEYITGLYREPEHFLPQEALPPQQENADRLSLQLTLEDTTDPAVIRQEAELLANVRYVFDPVIRRNDGIITSIYLASDRGFMLSYDREAHLSPSQYFNFREADWYRDSEAAGRPIFTDVYTGSFNRGLMATCTAPFYDKEGEYAGTVCIDMRLEDIHRELMDIHISSHSSAYLIDRLGRIIAGPEVDYHSADFHFLREIDASPEFQTVASSIRAGKKGVEEAGGAFYAYAPIEHVNWRLVIRVPRSDVISPVVEMRQDIDQAIENSRAYIGGRITSLFAGLAAVMAVVAVLVIWAAWGFTRKLVRPIRDMQHQVSVISQGNLEASVEVSTRDEIGALAAEFNHMASSLKDYISQVEKVTAEREHISAELNVARHIQASMLPNIFPPFPDRDEFDIYASMTPAKEVGGDFYDFFFVDHSHLAVVIADVSGKGVPAALFMVIAKTLIKDYASMAGQIEDVFCLVNDKLCESNDEGMFVTAWMGVLNLADGHVEYVNAGHNPPLIRHGSEPFRYLKQKPGFVLAGLEGFPYQKGEFSLEPGDGLYLYTDGVTEAANLQEELYGEMRLAQVLNENPGRMPQELLAAVSRDVKAYAGDAPQSDDITMLGLVYKGDRKR